jgi:hypothetical protein
MSTWNIRRIHVSVAVTLALTFVPALTLAGLRWSDTDAAKPAGRPAPGATALAGLKAAHVSSVQISPIAVAVVEKSPRSMSWMGVVLAFVLMLGSGALWWDSAGWKNPTHATHSRFPEFAIDRLRASFPELVTFQAQIIEGANQELHELKVGGTKYGLDLNAKRIEHMGTNEGCDDMQGWWRDCLEAYRAGRKEQAYFILGIMLHMTADMGVPAHANLVHHQGNATEFDNFEFIALWNWKPRFHINRADPEYDEPWKYYEFSRSWTQADAPGYNNRSTFSKTWLLAKQSERDLVSDRQGRTCFVTMWVIQSAVKAFAAPPQAPVQPAPATPSATRPPNTYNGVIYTVVKGDNLTFIARKFGVRSWQDFYFHTDNTAFRAKRPNPDLIYPGDVVKIPAQLQRSGGR